MPLKTTRSEKSNQYSMKIASYIGLVIGLAILTGLIAWQGLGEIWGLLAASGGMLLLVPAIWFPTVLMNARCWHLLFLEDQRPSFWQAFYAQWMGRAVNTLLPVASICGEVVKARVVTLWGTDARHASASTIVDKTVQVITLIFWGVLGVILLSTMALDNELVAAGIVGLALLGAGVAGFLVVQKAGIFGIAVKSAHKVTKAEFLNNQIDTAEEIDDIVLQVYRQRGPCSRRQHGGLVPSFCKQEKSGWPHGFWGFPLASWKPLCLKA